MKVGWEKGIGPEGSDVAGVEVVAALAGCCHGAPEESEAQGV